jgi:hypothetical protein
LLTALLSLTISFAPPAAGETDERAEAGQPASEFGPLEPGPEPTAPATDSASGGYGTVAPLPNYGEATQETEPIGPLIADEGADEPKPKDDGKKFQEPEDFGPFYEGEPASEVTFPADATRPKYPFGAVAGGRFCFIDNSMCGTSLIADADVGVGLNVITTARGLDVPYTQLRVRGGLVARPIILAKQRWHAWGVGVVGSWSIASSSITATNQDPTDPNVGVTETDPIQTYRVGLINQLWLSQKRNALHVDFTLGAANSSVLDFPGRYWGTTAEVALGFGGWGGLFLSGDFLDGDTRVVMGVRGHAIATGPLIALIVLGLVAGGVAL